MIDKLKKYEAIVASGEIGEGTRNEVAVMLGQAANEIAAKDAEIENLKKENASLRVINCGNYYADEQLRDELAAKDSMIAEQSAVNESQAAQLRDALNECEELKCAIADSKRISDAVVKSLRDKNLEMAGEIAAKDAEIEKLCALVKEMADALECAICGLSNKVVTYGETYRLVAKARKAIGGAE